MGLLGQSYQVDFGGLCMAWHGMAFRLGLDVLSFGWVNDDDVMTLH